MQIENWTPIPASVWQGHMQEASSLAMHSRYPKLLDYPPGCALDRLIRLVDNFFRECRSPDCLPRRGLPLIAYEGYDGGRGLAAAAAAPAAPAVTATAAASAAD